MEVNVNDMLVKSIKSKDHTKDLAECFDILKKYDMKLKPKKSSFGVFSRKSLGFIVNARGIEPNLEKIKALIEMPSPTKPNEVQALTGRMAALNRFILKSTDKCLPFFNVLRGNKKFEWTKECEEAFKGTKKHLSTPLFWPNQQLEKLYTFI
uniref:Uncharacterized protein n=1 Tax=Cannabis sativa TaxID=3483 RepID=A0A803NLM1_CANSA